jgi:hypothetical protein
MTHGYDEISILRRIEDGICVRPIWKVERMAIDVQMIECRPTPNYVG